MRRTTHNCSLFVPGSVPFLYIIGKENSLEQKNGVLPLVTSNISSPSPKLPQNQKT
jgi:hypothetical protein